MAFVSSGWWFVVQLADNGGDVTTKTYQLNSEDAEEAATDSAAVLSALTAVTDCEVLSYFTYEKFVEDTPLLPGNGVQIENLALLVFELAGNPLKSATHTIPGPKIGIFNSSTGPGANVVNTAHTDVVAYRSLFQNAGPCYISDGEKANLLREGRRIHRKSRRG